MSLDTRDLEGDCAQGRSIVEQIVIGFDLITCFGDRKKRLFYRAVPEK